MKSKWIVLGILMATGMVFWGAQNAQADTWATASINQVGQESTTASMRITVEGTSISDKWFKIKTDISKQVLAVALTAVSLGKNVNVLISTDGTTINAVKMNN